MVHRRKLNWPRATLIAAALAAVAVAGCSDRGQLRAIIEQQRIPHWLRDRNPAPCIRVALTGSPGSFRGYAVLPDRKGGAHLLLIPIEPLSGIEPAALWQPNAPNYFQAAWAARSELNAVVGHEVSRSGTGLAVNASSARSQDQLHIHIECLGRRVHAALAAARTGSRWTPIDVGGSSYQAIRVMGADLGQTNPFALLADQLPGARQAMAKFTLVVAGMQFSDGPGFVVLASRSEPGGELLLDSSCALARSQQRLRHVSTLVLRE